MTKKQKKIHLKKETLQNLGTVNLEKVRGGIPVVHSCGGGGGCSTTITL